MDPIRPAGLPPLPFTPRGERSPEPDPTPVDGFEPSGSMEEPLALIHPATPELFRRILQATLLVLPLELLRRIAEQGYRIHVVSRDHPLTLQLVEPRGRACGWGSQRLTREAWELLAEPGEKAGLVLHRAPGIRDEMLILFWDKIFTDELLEWYVLHELGHTTDYAFAFRAPERWRAWRERLQRCYEQRCFVTRYAGESLTEFFAESFAAWGRSAPSQAPVEGGELARERHQAWRGSLPQDLCRVIESIVNEP